MVGNSEAGIAQHGLDLYARNRYGEEAIQGYQRGHTNFLALK